MLDNIPQDAISRMGSAVNHTQNELNKIRTGRANPEIFDSIVIDYYGTPTPLNQVSTVSIPEPKLITLQAYEKSLIPIIEKAIVDANLGFTPGNNGNAVLVPIPALSEERRKELIKFKPLDGGDIKTNEYSLLNRLEINVKSFIERNESTRRRANLLRRTRHGGRKTKRKKRRRKKKKRKRKTKRKKRYKN